MPIHNSRLFTAPVKKYLLANMLLFRAVRNPLNTLIIVIIINWVLHKSFFFNQISNRTRLRLIHYFDTSGYNESAINGDTYWLPHYTLISLPASLRDNDNRVHCLIIFCAIRTRINLKTFYVTDQLVINPVTIFDTSITIWVQPT